jgi:hypothetical protein
MFRTADKNIRCSIRFSFFTAFAIFFSSLNFRERAELSRKYFPHSGQESGQPVFSLEIWLNFLKEHSPYLEVYFELIKIDQYCSRHGFLHQRMNANGSDTK